MSERVRWILLTHTHPDHWPAATKIAKKTGARIAGFAPFPKADEVTLELDIVLADGDTIDGTEFRLEALHTPGHAPNHLCFWLDEERTLFTGDHVLNGTTTVVNPQRGGDMIQYLASLDRLRKIKRVAKHLPGPRRRHGGSRGRARRVRRSPQDARAPDPQGLEGQARRRSPRSWPRSTPTPPTASSRWRSVRCTRTCSS